MARISRLALAMLACIIEAAPVSAQNLADQIAAVDLAQSRQRAAEAAVFEQRAAEAARAQAQRQAELREARRSHIAVEAELAAAARVRAEQAAQEAKARAVEAAAEKKREQDHEDVLRKLDYQARALELEAMKTRVSREGDFIDRELARKSAETDVVQSQADVNRTLSAGVSKLLQQEGQAEDQAASRAGVVTILK